MTKTFLAAAKRINHKVGHGDPFGLRISGFIRHSSFTSAKLDLFAFELRRGAVE